MGKSSRERPGPTPGVETRRANLRTLMEQRGVNALARQLGYANASFLSQMAGPNPIRGVTEKTARRFEARLGLPVGSLDRPVVQLAQSDAPQAVSVGLTAEIIRLVGRLFEEEGVDVSGMRFADVCALALLDAAEHDEQPRPDHVRSLVRLVKPQ